MLAAGVRSGRLFPRPDGSEWTESQYRSWRRHVYQRYAPMVGITGGRPYDLRGSWVSLMVWEGRTMLEVATMAGHSVQTCERHYARMFEGFDPAQRTSAEAATRAAREQLLRGHASQWVQRQQHEHACLPWEMLCHDRQR
jgi:hypothetical protein